MNIHQYVHLSPNDQVTAVRESDGTVCLTVLADGEPQHHLFLTEEQAAALRHDLTVPRHSRHSEPAPA